MIDLRFGNCVNILPTLESNSIDAIITDPPYPEITRPYGRMTVTDWQEMMVKVCIESRRLLKPNGSAVFILQPNSKTVGSMRGWLWEFMAWVCKEWNMVQDVWWWNFAALPSSHSRYGLLRPSLKCCVWCGPSDCYRNQNEILWSESEQSTARRLSNRVDAKSGKRKSPSGRTVDRESMERSIIEKGGVSPFNVIPLTNTDNGKKSAASFGHGAGTPLKLADWWIRYICPPKGIVLDPFMGAGTMAQAAIDNRNDFIGIENNNNIFEKTQRRFQSI